MVSYSDVLNSNESLKHSGSGLTAVFAGATSGIGLGALTAITKHTESPTIYILGRSQSRLDSLIESMKALNATATFHGVPISDLSLLKDADEACATIKATARRVDLLIMSPGYLSFLPRDPTAEGLDHLMSLRFYARMRLLSNLAPLLRASAASRVVSVLAGGREGALWADDMQLVQHHGLISTAGASASLTTLFLEEFAKQPGNEKIVLCHLYPGAVGGTGLVVKGLGPVGSFFLHWFALPFLRFVGYTPEEAGERVVFAATNGRYRRLSAEDAARAEGTAIEKGSNGVVGSGVYLVQGNGSVVSQPKQLVELREQGMGLKVWNHTMEEYDRIEKI